jgi:hypothetical protein
MKPDAAYKKLQRELQTLMESRQTSVRKGQLKKQLEAKFMAAWQFTSDRGGRAKHLRYSIRRFKKKDGSFIEGFDHCSFYTGANNERVIVTQPYGIDFKQLRIDLTLHKGIAPEIIDATEWAFYYPGKAYLVIVKCPNDYGRSLVSFQKLIEREKIDELLGRQSAIGSSRKPKRGIVALA